MIIINGSELKIEAFPNGEQKVREPFLASHAENIRVVLKWEHDQDLINLMFLKDNMGHRKATLEILYMPYSRMDRYILGDMFTLKSACNFINFLSFDRVIVHEPHSDVTPALLDNCQVVNTTMDLFNHFEKAICKPDYVFYPDAGAQKRYHTSRYPTLVGNKVRNPHTGWIESFTVVSDVNSFGDKPTIVIMDDLSSYGGTFLHSAKALKAMGAGDIYLIVAHAEESILRGEIFSSGLFKKVLTTNSIIDISKGSDQLLINELY